MALVVKNLPANAGSCKRHRFDPWVGKIGRWAQQSTPAFLPGESHGQRSLAGYSPQNHRVRYDWRDSACTHAWAKNRLAELIYFRRQGYSLLFRVPLSQWFNFFPSCDPCSHFAFPCEKGERKTVWDSSRGGDLAGCESAEGPGLSQHSFPWCAAAGLPKPSSCWGFHSCGCHHFPELAPGASTAKSYLSFRALHCWVAVHSTHGFVQKTSHPASCCVYSWIRSQWKAKQNRTTFYFLESHPVLWALSRFSFPPLSQSVEGRKSPVTQTPRPKKGPICFVCRSRELPAVVLADLHRSQISFLCYPTTQQPLHITKHVYLGLLEYFHIMLCIYLKPILVA